MRNKLPAYIIFLSLMACLVWSGTFPLTMALAQEPTPQGPVYIVQAGDTLWGIAARLGISVQDLQSANNISDPGQLRVGDRLLIPGMEGVQGVIVTATVVYGETIDSLSQHYQIPTDLLARLNRLTSPSELFAGATLILPQQEGETISNQRTLLTPGQSVLELAVSQGINPWSLADLNKLDNTWSAVPRDVLLSPKSSSGGPGGLPGLISDVRIEPLSLLQGKVSEILINTRDDISLSGSLMGHELRFYPESGKGFLALQGVHAMTDPGLYPLDIQGRLPNGAAFFFSQMVPVKAIEYPYDQPLTVNPATIDPAITKPEDAEWSALAAPSTAERYWNGMFKLPSPLGQDYCVQTNDCWASGYGNRRSYNGSPYNFFHTGLDIVGRTGTDIYAPADGVVVFAGPLTVRGNATMINHGQGIYTGYMHQSEILVKPGDVVKAGQLIGKVGDTGRVQGPHLHWEVWVGGVQVDPLDWLVKAYP